ncbi:hypothetical protein L6164_011727 [Bauhinia variegata]|uniref:Uncharacterized protein n=1 Tax=Bauhinia variegata TaxID=167791 RepID=A0ACB9PC50_BAUVA|nr:hypothetical protein L6164_011727 [Bauhinia variegata]
MVNQVQTNNQNVLNKETELKMLMARPSDCSDLFCAEAYLDSIHKKTTDFIRVSGQISSHVKWLYYCIVSYDFLGTIRFYSQLLPLAPPLKKNEKKKKRKTEMAHLLSLFATCGLQSPFDDCISLTNLSPSPCLIHK